MNRGIFFGQYLHKKSVIHGLDPRLKIIYIILLSIMLLLSNGLSEMLAFSAFVFAVIILTRVKVVYFVRNLVPFQLVFVFILAMYMIFSPGQLQQGFIALWRFIILILLSSILTFTTTMQELVTSIESLARPLKGIGIKPRNAATMVSAAIRFIPVMFDQFERQKDAMLARLADFKRLRNIRMIVRNLLEKMLKSAYFLSEAMQSRLYNENARSHSRLIMGMNDYASILLVLAFVILIW